MGILDHKSQAGEKCSGRAAICGQKGLGLPQQPAKSPQVFLSRNWGTP